MIAHGGCVILVKPKHDILTKLVKLLSRGVVLMI